MEAAHYAPPPRRRKFFRLLTIFTRPHSSLLHAEEKSRIPHLRDYYRLDVHFPLSFFNVSPEDNRPLPEETRMDASLPRMETHVLNLSAGGLSVEKVEQKEDVGERLMVDPRYELSLIHI